MESRLILTQYKDAVNKSSIFSKTDVAGRITYVNDKFCEITGYTEDELIGQTHAIVKDPSNPDSLFKELWSDISSGKIWKGVVKNRKKDGNPYYVNSTIYPIKDDDGKILEYISIRQDITELINSQKLVEIYSTDRLTNLPNRQKLIEKLKESTDELMSIFLDIKDFSLINELYGEDVGDELLIELSAKLKAYLVNDSATLYKLDSDHYLILVDNKNLFRKYESLVKFTFLSEDTFVVKDIVVNFNIGISYGTDDLLNKSSLALKEAKKLKSRFFEYCDSLDIKDIHKKNQKSFEIFKDALLNDRIEPFFQPIVDAQTEEVIKYEALARIREVDGTILAIGEFLSIAQKSSFFENFTRQIIQKIFAISSLSNKEVTINLVYEHINSDEVVKYIENRLKMHKGPRITFEILESEEINDYDVLENFIDMVKGYGALIAIDDFGSGYSNFIHLVKFKADYIKIDGSIINDIEKDKSSQQVLSLLVKYAKQNNIKVIAEFIKDENVARVVKGLGVDLLQGYYYGKPESAEFYKLTS